MEILIISLIVGLFIIALGIFSSHYPNIIAGYSKLSDEVKQSDTTKKFIIYIKKASIITGIIMIIGNSFSFLLNMDVIGYMFLIFPPVIMTISILFQKKKRNNSFYILLLLMLGVFFPTISLFYGMKDISIFKSDSVIQIRGGLYDEQIQQNDIVDLQLIYKIPKIRSKINGFGFGKVRQGLFLLDGLGKTNLFLQNIDSPPYIFIKGSETYYLLNLKDSTTINNFNIIRTHISLH